jgi:glycosyltransferase involved in cell wall biosynthesis
VTRRVGIGVHVHAEPAQLAATLDSLRANTTGAFDILLLGDGPDEATRYTLDALDGFARSSTAEPRGPAACFNRLAAKSRAGTLVLLESGSLVGPGWLQHLLQALDSDPRNGLAGPTTNASWNEQGVYPLSGGTPEEIARTAAHAVERFGAEARTLEPLYSLADFCYVVRRAVIDTIGKADEGYELGPCWEMDYNVRAARAGFRGVWACAAYVHRGPFTARRAQEESRRFEASKRRYQDHFCGARLRGESTTYRAHCRGDDCPNFAPAALIAIRGDARTAAAASPADSVCPPQAVPGVRARTRSAAAAAAEPLVSCIMPTRNRRSLVRLAVQLFQDQDYVNRELIVVDDGDDPIGDLVSRQPHIRYFRLPDRLSIGAKRNFACQHARGEIIAHWDDDDWYARDRLRYQVAPILAGQADITGLENAFVLDVAGGRFWTTHSGLHQQMFVGDVHGGTLTFGRQLWSGGLRYPEVSLAEDAWLLVLALRHGWRLLRLPNPGVFIYMRHSRNTWSECVPGRFLDPEGWKCVPPPPTFPLAALASYQSATKENGA